MRNQGCTAAAEWMVAGIMSPDDLTFTCPEHLNELLSPHAFQLIQRVPARARIACRYAVESEDLLPESLAKEAATEWQGNVRLGLEEVIADKIRTAINECADAVLAGSCASKCKCDSCLALKAIADKVRVLAGPLDVEQILHSMHPETVEFLQS